MLLSRLAAWRRMTMCGITALIPVVLPGFVTAQVTYSVIPALPQESQANASQPTGSHSASRVTLSVSDSTVRYIVGELARQAQLRVVYDGSAMLQRRVTVHVAGMAVMDALVDVLKGTGLTAKIAPDGETVMIRTPSGVSSTDRRRLLGGMVTGRVTDSASGAGLGGASVRVMGTKLSAVTSDSGNFTLRDVPAGDQVLSAKLFGYKPAERTVTVVDSQRTTVRIALASVPTVLSGVVTTATGLQHKVDVGNDITTLNVDSIRQVAPITSVTDLLETRVPGLTVLRSSGTPGDPSRLRLRGAGSIQGNNDPIVIVNGVRVYASQSDKRNNSLAAVPGININGTGNLEDLALPSGVPSGVSAPSPLDQIDPSDIETIEVLKGPSATAIYGSDAANGVVVITTKHGRAGPTHWDLGLGAGVNWIPGSWPINYYRFGADSTGIDATNVGGSAYQGMCIWYNPSCAMDSLVAFQALNEPQYTVFGRGSDQTANLNVSGGTQTLTYSLSGSGSGDLGMLKMPVIEQQRYDSVYGATYGPVPKGLVRPDNYTTWGVGGTITAIPTPTLRVSLQSSLFTSSQHQGTLSSAIPQLMGEYVSPSRINLQGIFIENDVTRITNNSQSSTNAMSMHWQPVPWLPLDATGGLNTIQTDGVSYVPFGINTYGVVNSAINGVGDTTGYYGSGRGLSQDNTLSAGTAIPLKLVTLALGGQVYSQRTSDVSGLVSTVLAPGVTVPSNACAQVVRCGTISTSGVTTYGWYVEPRLNFASRFFATPGFRLDGGSNQGTGVSSSVGAFPKIDLSYVAVNRGGGRPLWGVLSLLRPRLAFGVAGIQPPPQNSLRLFNASGNALVTVPPNSGGGGGSLGGTAGCTTTVTLDGSSVIPAVCLTSLGNTQLHPERTQELEGGVDAVLWSNRLSITYTQYDKTTHDAILSVPVAPSVVSLGNIEKNIGVIRNTGTEVTMQATLVESRALSWNVGANLSNDNSLVVRLNPGQAPICYGNATQVSHGCSGTQIKAGFPLFGEWARPIVSFADANHNGVIDSTEIRYGDSTIYVGQPNPKYQFNMTTGITLFNGTLSANATFAYMNGLTQDNAAACASGVFLGLPNAPNTPLATEAAVVAAGCGGQTGPSVTTIGLIQTVNTFRFNALSINYQVPRPISARFRVPRMTLALQGSNLGLHTNYRGKDPAVNAFSTVSAGDETADLGQIPQPRTWWLRMTLGN